MTYFIKTLGSMTDEQKKEIEKIKKKNKIKVTIKKFIQLILFFLFLSLIYKFLLYTDNFLCDLIKLKSIHFNDNYFEIVNNMFGIQATLATLTIAFISIFSGFIKDKIYGIYITNYIFNNENGIGIYKLSIILILFTFAYFIFLIKSAYIICLLIFFLTLILIIYIMKRILILMSNYEEIEEDIKKYINELIKKSAHSLDYKGIEDNSIEYILEKKPELKKIYRKIDKLICDLYKDTIEKINNNDFNGYQKNIILFNYIINDFNCNDMNALRKDLLVTLMQRVDELTNILIRNKKIFFALDLLETQSLKLKFAIQDKNLSNTTKQDLLDSFDITYFLKKICTNIKDYSYYNSSLLYRIEDLLYNCQNLYIMFIEINILTENYEKEKIIFENGNLYNLYINSIKNNRYFKDFEKDEALKRIKDYEKDYMKDNTHWGNYLNYSSIEFIRKCLCEREENKKNENYDKINEELKNIKEELKDIILNSLN